LDEGELGVKLCVDRLLLLFFRFLLGVKLLLGPRSVWLGRRGGGETIGEAVKALLGSLDLFQLRLEFADDVVMVQPGVFSSQVAVVHLLPTELGDHVLEGERVMSSELGVGVNGGSRSHGLEDGRCDWGGRRGWQPRGEEGRVCSGLHEQCGGHTEVDKDERVVLYGVG
jgi:hypothetical protein